MEKIIQTNDEVFVAFMDILGFKDLVEKNAPETIAKVFENISEVSKITIQQMREAAEELSGESNDVDEEIKNKIIDTANLNIISISDSFMIWTNDDDPISLNAMCIFVRSLLGRFMLAGVPLRGAISSGPLMSKKLSFGSEEFNQINVFGKGIVSAYLLEGKQQWSGCIVDEKCIEKLKLTERGEKVHRSLKRSQVIKAYHVPLSYGMVEEQVVLDWTQTVHESSLGEQANEITNYFAAHNKNINEWSVKVKIDNTIRFAREMKGI